MTKTTTSKLNLATINNKLVFITLYKQREQVSYHEITATWAMEELCSLFKKYSDDVVTSEATFPITYWGKEWTLSSIYLPVNLKTKKDVARALAPILLSDDITEISLEYSKENVQIGYQVNVEETDKLVLLECYGEKFPKHPKFWFEDGSLWQEDYFRLVLQKDIGTLTVYDATHEVQFLWEGHFKFKSLHDLYHYFNEEDDPFADTIYGDEQFREEFYRNRKGITQHPKLSLLRLRFNQAYEYYMANKDKEASTQN